MLAPSRDTFVLECVQHARPMLFNLAQRCNVEIDDLLQEAAVLTLLRYDRAMQADNPQGYMQRAIRSHALAQIGKTYHDDTALSLDAPRGEGEDDYTLLDTLAAPVDQDQDHTMTDQRTAALHTALNRLALDEQQYMRQHYKLNSYNPVPHWHDGKISKSHERSQHAISQAAYRHLRADRELAAQVLEM